MYRRKWMSRVWSETSVLRNTWGLAQTNPSNYKKNLSMGPWSIMIWIWEFLEIGYAKRTSYVYNMSDKNKIIHCQSGQLQLMALWISSKVPPCSAFWIFFKELKEYHIPYLWKFHEKYSIYCWTEAAEYLRKLIIILKNCIARIEVHEEKISNWCVATSNEFI